MITFASGLVFDTVSVQAGSTWYDGTFRKNLRIDFLESTVDFSVIRGLMTDVEELSSIRLSETDGNGNVIGEYTYVNYVLGKSITCGSNGLITLELAQKTDAEVLVETFLAGIGGLNG